MKKLIVLFLLLCSGVIYFIGSGCSGEDSCAAKPPGPEIAGPTVDDCSTVPVPVSDFTTAKTEYLVGETVNYTFTGTLGVPEDNGIRYKWVLPGAEADFIDLVEKNPSIHYNAPGIYSAAVTVKNGCWSNKKIKLHYITIKAPGVE